MTERLFAKLFFTASAIGPYPFLESINKGRDAWFLAASLLVVWLERYWMPVLQRIWAIVKDLRKQR